LDEKQNVKLGDFGLAKSVSGESQFAKTYVGSPFYMSPE
jgi:NIMA (never in mitosis gene a)-related kinase